MPIERKAEIKEGGERDQNAAILLEFIATTMCKSLIIKYLL